MRAIVMALAATLILNPTAGLAGADGIVIDRAVAGATHKGAQTGAGYLTFTNHGSSADRLLAIEAAFDRVMLHETQVTDGVARMVHLMGGIEIAPGATVTMVPGAMHIMFIGLGVDGFQVGAQVPTVLIFETAGRVASDFSVLPLAELAGHD